MYKALRSVVPEVVRFGVHDVARLHTGSIHRCYRMHLPYTTRTTPHILRSGDSDPLSLPIVRPGPAATRILHAILRTRPIGMIPAVPDPS